MDNLIPPIEEVTEEFISPLQKEQEDQNEENFEEISSSRDTENQLPLNNILVKLIDDLTNEKDEVFTRITPLVEVMYKEKLKEIISRLKVENRGRQRDQHIKTLEACYYLGQLRENSKENKQRIKYTRNTLKKSLEPRRADRIWKCAERAYKLFQVCGLPRLCSTTRITFTNLEELSDEDFTELLDSVEIRSAHF